jgi:DNA-binding MarR family transcriptional regulator
MTMTDTALLTGQDIGEAESAMTALLERVIAPTGRSRSEYITLRVLAAQSPYRSDAELIDFLASQRQLGLAPADVVTMLDRLQVDGLITASPVELTARGRALLDELATAVAPATRQLFTGLDPNDLAVAHRFLVDLIQRAQAMTSTA